MARPVKKKPDQWKREILSAAKELFLSKGYEDTSITDIMERAGGAKGMFYRFFASKEEVIHALGDQMFFQNDPFEAVRERSDLNGLEKIREVLALNRADTERESINAQAVEILRDPRILAAAIEANRRVLTPLWFELIEEGRRDGSIKTEYARELSELLPLVNFWVMPTVFPGDGEAIQRKCRFIAEVLAAMGLPIIDDEMRGRAERIFGAVEKSAAERSAADEADRAEKSAADEADRAEKSAADEADRAEKFAADETERLTAEAAERLTEDRAETPRQTGGAN